MTSVWLRLALALDSAERLRGVGRWLAGAAIWGTFAAVWALPVACGYWLGSR